ncbi:hypothetical protein L6164_005229 [Bauhinia variegata]|uniref:Uncharacterized protein n=1 Tax=Bauhinia variegata TaxID=167791 RepID=A0ACB9PPW7_BAUVA|nr:hypothetical protein L6164_005229 [Bauhinia variegata]
METRKWLFLLGVSAFYFLLFQTTLLPSGNSTWPPLPENHVSLRSKTSHPSAHSTSKSYAVRNPLTVNASDLSNSSAVIHMAKKVDFFTVGDENRGHDWLRGMENDMESDLASEKHSSKSDYAFELREVRAVSDSHGFPKKNTADINENKNDLSVWKILVPKGGKSMNNEVENRNNKPREPESVDATFQSSLSGPNRTASTNLTYLRNLVSNANPSVGSTSQKNDLIASDNGTARMSGPRKMRCNMPPKSRTLIHEMEKILARNRRSSRAMRPRWSSKLDQEILAVKSEIEHAPIVTSDKELYAPLFRNISMFKRSYELMERKLKVYVYKEGNKPIFHQPILKGLYASEGWFMKLMEGNKQFVVKDPRQAHLFYMPFSSRMLEFSLYVRNSHNRTNLRWYLKDYTEKISAKYRYFNRTDGADHFLVACHDWAPYETKHHMEHCIKALCNADVTQGFKIGRDVSLPETYVRSARNPQRDLGGKPPHQRSILAFYAGNMHGYLRPILLKHWKDKDPDMKIFGPMPPGVANKMNYIQHMKSSKYCICPKGYEVNSPRVVEAIFYECVPVIISDNFVPSFFEVLNWDAFSVILAEKDIPNLKRILDSIPQEKYLKLQLGVRRVQKHFLWHAKPLKYDLFHMTLHSIWYNRVFQIKAR